MPWYTNKVKKQIGHIQAGALRARWRHEAAMWPPAVGEEGLRYGSLHRYGPVLCGPLHLHVTVWRFAEVVICDVG